MIVVLLLLLNLSCADKKPTAIAHTSQEVLQTTKSDTLQFTSGIRAILQDSKGNYWLGSHTEGVCKFDGKTFEYFTTKEGLAHNQVRAIQEDEKGIIWFETGSGPCSYDGKTITNHTIALKSYPESNWQKAENDLWFTRGDNEGVYRYDGQNIHYLTFPKPATVDPMNNYMVTGMTKGKNTQWFATYPAVFGFDGKNTIVIDNELLGLKVETGGLHVRSVFEDSKGRLWIGNNGIGVLLKEGDSIINFSEKHHLIHPESKRRGDKSPAGTLEHVFAITEDSDGNMWFGDRDTGAWKFDGKTFTNYTIDEKLTSPMIWFIYKDKANNLFFGLANGGVYKFTENTFEKVF